MKQPAKDPNLNRATMAPVSPVNADDQLTPDLMTKLRQAIKAEPNDDVYNITHRAPGTE